MLLALILELRRKRTEQAHRETRRVNQAAGLNEPVSLHPVIDPSVCIGSAACVESCPEGTVLGLVGGLGTLIAGSKCVGHGRCAHECPVDAIRLVFGTSERGVDIPHVSENYESNVDGLYIVGELGGMGLVRNAVRQGRDAVRHLAKARSGGASDGEAELDLIIVGAGPAGVAAAVTAKQLGLSVRLLDRERTFGGALVSFPRAKIVQTQPMELPGVGIVRAKEIPKEELLDLLRTALRAAQVKVECGQEVVRVARDEVAGKPPMLAELASGEVLRARSVVLAMGRRGMPRKLGVPGEEQPHVSYSLYEPAYFANCRVLVVGGGNSAVEAALRIAQEPRAPVFLSYRRRSFARVTETNRARLEEAVAEGDIQLYLESTVERIEADSVVLRTPAGLETLGIDRVLIQAGGVLPTAFLERAGIKMAKKYGEA